MAAAAAHRPSTSLTGALCLCGLVLSGSIEAALYRWVDDSGTTVYSQSPPPDGKAELIQGGPKGATPGETSAARARLQRTIEADFDQREERKKAAPEKAKREEAEARRKRNCTAARQDLEALKAPGPRRVRYPDGTYRNLTSDDAKEQRDLAQQQVDEFCKPARPAYPLSLDGSPGAAPARPAYPPSLDGK